MVVCAPCQVMKPGDTPNVVAISDNHPPSCGAQPALKIVNQGFRTLAPKPWSYVQTYSTKPKTKGIISYASTNIDKEKSDNEVCQPMASVIDQRGSSFGGCVTV